MNIALWLSVALRGASVTLASIAFRLSLLSLASIALSLAALAAWALSLAALAAWACARHGRAHTRHKNLWRRWLVGIMQVSQSYMSNAPVCNVLMYACARYMQVS